MGAFQGHPEAIMNDELTTMAVMVTPLKCVKYMRTLDVTTVGFCLP